MIKIFAIAAFALFTSFRLPGSGTAYLKGRSASGRTIFTAELQDITSKLEKATLSVDGKKLAFTSSDQAFTIFDPEHGVFTVYITGETDEEFTNSRFIEFWAIPQTFKVIKSSRDKQKYEFKARLEATEPRKEKNLRTPQVELTCTLEYRI